MAVNIVQSHHIRWGNKLVEGLGKRRGVIQKAFNLAESSGKFIVKRISNFLN